MTLVDTTAGGREVSILALVNILLRQRWVVVTSTLAVASLVSLVSLALPRTHSSAGRFLPEADNSNMTRLSGLAAQFGLTVPGTGGQQSPEFYVALLRSREILGTIAVDTFQFVAVTGRAWWRDTVRMSGTPIELFEINPEGPLAKRRDLAIERLLAETSAEADRETGLVRWRVTTPWPELSRLMADRMLELVVTFDLEKRQSQAGAERRFIEGRVQATQEELRDAENELEAFLRQNREFARSPSLRFEHDRLERKVVLLQQVVTSLIQSFEQARVDEVRNTPSITVVDEPEIPARPDRRYLILKGLLGLTFGGVLGVVIALVRETMSGGRGVTTDEFREFMRLRDQTTQDLKRLVRLRRTGSD
jgi:uncharacterized protein involved in exopolysaccharide biosynthesis